MILCVSLNAAAIKYNILESRVVAAQKMPENMLNSFGRFTPEVCL